MLSDNELLGVERSNPSTLKPLKVRLPLAQVLQLHRMRIVGDRTVSQIVEDALEQYLNGIQKEVREKKETTV